MAQLVNRLWPTRGGAWSRAALVLGLFVVALAGAGGSAGEADRPGLGGDRTAPAGERPAIGGDSLGAGPRRVAPKDGRRPAGVAGEATARAGIEQLLERRARAVLAKDERAFLATIDREHRAFVRQQTEHFERYVEIDEPLPLPKKVLSVRHHRNGFYKAKLDTGFGADAARVWIFRPVDGRWVHTEPQEQDLGERSTRHTAHFALRYYAWDDDVIDRVAELAEDAHEHVTGVLHWQPADKTTIYLVPTFGTWPGVGTGGQFTGTRDAFYATSLDTALLAADELSQEDQVFWSLSRGYAYLVHNLKVNIGSIPRWLSDGLAEAVAFDPEIRDHRLAAAVATRLFSLDELNRISHGREELKLQPWELAAAHDQWIGAVLFLVDRFGLERFWRYCQDYAGSGSLADAAQRVYGISFEQLDREWQEWAHEAYGDEPELHRRSA
ncbi:MAG: hypothetical protein HY329_14880 [Chloroflexi bacterium]|nr:hypothetical protein [Chloroflexota bacterium]